MYFFLNNAILKKSHNKALNTITSSKNLGVAKMRRTFLSAAIALLSVAVATTALAFQPVYVMGSGNMGGTYYSLCGIIAETVNNKVPGVKMSVLPTGGTVDNVSLMGSGLCQFALMDSFAVMAYNGKDMFYEKPQTYLKGVVPLYPEVARILVPKGSAIKSVKDLTGKKVVMGRKGSGVLMTSQQILRMSGLRNDAVKPEYLGMGEGLLALKNGQVDAVIFVGPIGGGSAMEQELLSSTSVIGLDKATIKKLIASAPYWKEFTIPAGTFPNQKESLLTVGAWTVLYCREELSPELVEKVTGAIYNNISTISSYIPGSVKLSPEQTAEVLVPLHEGAARFFKKKGSK